MIYYYSKNGIIINLLTHLEYNVNESGHCAVV